MAPPREYALYFAIALFASLALTFAARALARQLGWVAKPRADRWHRKPTALFGGVGIFAAFVVAYGIRRATGSPGGGLLVACSAGMFLLGLVDDKVQLKPYAKLIGQIVLATLFTTFGLRLHWLANPILDHGLTIFWLVGVTNALNLLDNIDGAAAGVAAIAGGYLIYFCHHAGQHESAILAACFVGGTLGVLVYNFNPASIFMGDCGSLFLGFFLAGLSLVNAEIGARRNMVAVLAIPVLLLLLPILDTTLVTIARRYHGRSISQGGRDHTSHRLVAIGLSERGATLTLWLIAAGSGAVAVVVSNISTLFSVALLGVFVYGLVFLMLFLGRVKVYEQVDSPDEAPGRALLPTLADFSYKRRVFETLNDLVLIILCYYGAFLLRFDGQVEGSFLPQFVRSLPTVIVSQLAVFLAMGLYRGVWRYTGMNDLGVIVRSVGGAVGLSTIAMLFLFRFENLSRAVMVIDGLLLLIGVSGTRLSFRLLRQWLVPNRPLDDARRVLVYGAGDGGELLVRELQRNPELRMAPVGFLDDDPQKVGRLIHGVPVLGAVDDLPRLLNDRGIQDVVLSTNKITAERRERIERTCQEQGLGCRRLRISFE